MLFSVNVYHHNTTIPHSELKDTTVGIVQREMENISEKIHLLFRHVHVSLENATNISLGRVFGYSVIIFDIEIFIHDSVNRLHIEEGLNSLLTRTVNGSGDITFVKFSSVIDEPVLQEMHAREAKDLLEEKSEDASFALANDSLTWKSDLHQNNHSIFDTSNITTWQFSSHFYRVRVNSAVLCRQVELEPEEYNITQSLHLHLLRTDVYLEFAQYNTAPDGSIRVCLEILNDISYFQQDESSLMDRLMWIISLSCTIVSIICLILCIGMYCLIPTLCNTPGKLMMLLMTSLLITLIFLQLSMAFTRSEIGCIIVGVILHLFWLTVFTCMFACNYHMFKVFTSSKIPKQSSKIFFDGLMIRKIIFVLLIPFSIILMYITVSLLVSGGMSLGYGGSKCFIISSVPLIVTFILPIVLICIVNGILFTVTLRAIHLTPTPMGNTSDRHELSIFIRLFSITGLSWLLQAIDSFLPLTVFSLVTAIINSLQGFFIFLAFGLTKRNVNSLLERFSSKKHDGKSIEYKTEETPLQHTGKSDLDLNQ